MATATKTRSAKPDSEISLSAGDILAEQQQAQRRALAEAALYRQTVHEAIAGTATDEAIQAARIIGNKWNWSWEQDRAALEELNRLHEKYPEGIRETAERLWQELTEKASAIRVLQEDTAKLIRQMEIERRDVESKHVMASSRISRPDELRAKHPHLFSAEA